MTRMLFAAIFALFSALAAVEGHAAPPTLSADRAAEAAAAGEVVLVDIRTPEEWAATGAPAGAAPLSLQDPEFGPKLSRLLEAAGERPLAMICATGGRTGYATKVLERHGLTVINIAEGMMGSGAGPGWIARGLPLEKPGPAAFEERLRALAE